MNGDAITSKVAWGRVFAISAGSLLGLAGAAKIISSFGTAPVLLVADPIFGLLFRTVFRLVGLFECLVAALCLSSRGSPHFKALLLAWLATCFAVYEVGLAWVGYRGECHCLGNLTGVLHISPQFADIAMKIILVYLLVGSYGTLCWFWRQNRKARPLAQPKGAAVSAG